MFQLYVGLLMWICIYVALPQLHTNFDIEWIRKCSANKGPIKVNFLNLTKRDGRQYFNLDALFRIPLNKDVGSTCKIEYAADGKTFLELFNVREKYFCKAANDYMGEFWYDLQRAAQTPPGVCPVPAGHYHVHNHLLDYKKIKLQTFPFGKLRITQELINNRDNSTLLCLFANIQNTDN